MRYFNVVAMDLDGTNTVDGDIPAESLEAIENVRASGVAVVLATGRIQAELEGDHPGLTDHFDAVVLENGAVVVSSGRARAVAPPLDPGLDELLASRGVPFRTGRVLRALDGEFASAAVEAVADLGVDHQVVRNRAAAMVLPAGVTKGTGLVAALADLHHSPRNALAVGDAENDLALLVAAEVGAAVPHSVPSLLRRADLVLPTGPGNGLPALLRVPLLDGAERLCPARHWIPSGVFDDDRLGPRARLADDGPRRGGAVLRQKLPGRAARGAVDHGRLPCSSSTRRATTPSSATCPACSSWRSPSVRRSPSRC